MTPLAGFFNCLIFIRPRYLQMRDRYKNDSSTFLAFTTIRSLILGSSSQSAAGTSAFPGGSTTQENNNHNNNSSNNHHRLAQMNWSQNAYLQDITSGFAGARTSCLVEEDDVEEAADMFKVETSQSQVESTKDPTEQMQAVHFWSNDWCQTRADKIDYLLPVFDVWPHEHFFPKMTPAALSLCEWFSISHFVSATRFLPFPGKFE